MKHRRYIEWKFNGGGKSSKNIQNTLQIVIRK